MNPSPIQLLIVDDDPVFARLVRQIVESLSRDLPCEPAWVDSAEKALEELARTPYELVLLDYNLPGADGLQVLEQIRNLPDGQQPAVIMLTASGNESIAVEAMKRGAKDYLPKADLDVAPLLRAITNALAQKRLAEQVARYNAQTKADLDMAHHLQEALLPERYPNFPHAAPAGESALQFCHRYYWTTELGGDFFTVLDLADTQAGVFICDVMGHGVRAALVTAMLRALVDDLTPVAVDPGRFLTELNHRLMTILKRIESPLFATAFYLVADLGAGQIRYANAGHPYPLHLQRGAAATGPLTLQQRHGPALGLFDNTVYDSAVRPMADGDLVLLFTDGLFEVTNPADEEYGQERLRAAAQKHMTLPAPALLDKLIEEIRQFSAGNEFADDVCLLGMEVHRTGKGAP